MYYQTQYVNGVYVSPKALTDNTTGVTNVLVGAIHLDPDVVHLNDAPPESPKFTQRLKNLVTTCGLDALDLAVEEFYCGWGSMASTTGYDNILNRGVVAASKVIAGVVTNSANCSGYVPLATLKSTPGALVAKYPTFGGVSVPARGGLEPDPVGVDKSLPVQAHRSPAKPPPALLVTS